MTIILEDNECLKGELYDNVSFDTLIKVKGDNVVIRDCSFNNIHSDFKRVISVEGKNCLIVDCLFGDIQGEGPLIVLERKDNTNENNLVISNNTFFNLRSSGDNGNEVIRLGWSGTSLDGVGNCIISGNRFENVEREIELISVKCNDNLIISNEFIGCKGTITLRHGEGSVVAYNYINGNGKSGSGGIRVIDTGHTIKGNLIINTTGTGLRAPISLMCSQENPELNGYRYIDVCVIYENQIVSNKTGIAVGCIKESRGNVVPPNNVYVENNYYINNTDYDTDNTSGAINLKELNNKTDQTIINYDIPFFEITDYIDTERLVREHKKEIKLSPITEDVDDEVIDDDVVMEEVKEVDTDKQQYYQEKIDLLTLQLDYYKSKLNVV